MFLTLLACYNRDMALFVNQNDKRSQLQERVAAELRAKAAERAKIENESPDGVTDQNYTKDMKTTTSLAGVWVAIGVFIVAAIIFFAVQLS